MKKKEFKNIAPVLYELKSLDKGFSTPVDYINSFDSNFNETKILARFNKTNSFNTPSSYFTTIEDTVIDRIDQENNSVPNGYFDTLESNVFEKLNKEPKVIELNTSKRKWIASVAIAASLALLFTLQIFTSSSNLDFSSLSSTEIENWISEGEMEVNSYEVATLYEDLNPDNYDIYDSYNEDDLLDYLDNVNIESLILTD
ncbi:hypothetical protein [Urechidicola vernalis]|uniref:Uncharacterized protein n=1 Tax=Urechidicola vernalis TaxID=3075600 RepID=A0ABU2Y0J4_9FLAO|nr:hypothetical protein [Urechidicola sp. P050]MDT0551679.1 hypothetical protein [Urechidicola sp. P050]